MGTKTVVSCTRMEALIAEVDWIPMTCADEPKNNHIPNSNPPMEEIEDNGNGDDDDDDDDDIDDDIDDDDDDVDIDISFPISPSLFEDDNAHEVKDNEAKDTV